MDTADWKRNFFQNLWLISLSFLALDKGVPEVQSRSILTLHSKLSSKVLKPDQLITHFSNLPGVLLTWINENQLQASEEILIKIVEVLSEIARVNKHYLNLFFFSLAKH